LTTTVSSAISLLKAEIEEFKASQMRLSGKVDRAAVSSLACTRLEALGERISSRSVRRVTEHGRLNDIAGDIVAWRTAKEARRTLPPLPLKDLQEDASQVCQTAFAQIFQEALKLAERRLANDRRRWEFESEQALDQRNKAVQAFDVAEARRKDTQTQLEDRQRRLDDTLGRIEVLSNKVATLEYQLAQLTAENQRLRSGGH
jgi:chromosome segregation ATPase